MNRASLRDFLSRARSRQAVKPYRSVVSDNTRLLVGGGIFAGMSMGMVLFILFACFGLAALGPVGIVLMFVGFPLYLGWMAWDDWEKERQQGALATVVDGRWHFRNPGEPVPVIGPELFTQTANAVIEELRTKLHHRYRELNEFMPQIRYDPGSLEPGVLARSGGLFSIDGSDYRQFRWVLLHELGHNYHQKYFSDSSEKAANDYADMVLREMEYFEQVVMRGGS